MNSWIHSHVILVLSIVVLDQHVNMILGKSNSILFIFTLNEVWKRIH